MQSENTIAKVSVYLTDHLVVIIHVYLQIISAEPFHQFRKRQNSILEITVAIFFTTL